MTNNREWMKTLKFLIIAILVTITIYPNIAFANISKSVISVNDTQYDITFNTENLSINKISTNLHSYVYNSLGMNITSNKQYNGSLTLTLTKDAVANVFCITRSDIDNYLKSGSAFDVTVDNNHKNFTTSTTNDEVSLTFDIPKGSQNATIFNEFVGMAVSPLIYFKGIPQTGTYSSGQDVIFNGTLVDACGRHLGVEKVYFTAEQLNVTKEVASDTNGKFSINFTIPANTESGNYTSKIEMYQYGLAYPLRGVETLYLNVGTNNTQNVPESPLQQFKSGTPASDVKCNDGLQLIIKAEDGSPACVKPDTAQILKERGWTKEIVTQTSQNNTLPASFMPCDTPYPQSNTGIPVLYMSTNSIGKICVTYSNPNDTTQSISTAIAIHDPNISYQQVPDISTWIVYGFPTISGKGNSTFVYEIKTGNQTGFYLLDLTCDGKPFAVVNDNKSKIVASDFPFIGTGSYCPALSYSVHLDGITGIGVRYIPQK